MAKPSKIAKKNKPTSGIPARDARLLYQQSGNRCAYPPCTRTLSFPKTDKDGSIPTSEVAHIVAESLDGPRGDDPLPLDERNRYENLILLCEEHHHVIDNQIATYPVERLRQMKYDHEAIIAEATRRAVESRAGDHSIAGSNIEEQLFSTLMPFERLPRYIFSIECEDSEGNAKQKLLKNRSGHAAPFIIRGKRLYCFQNLRDEPGPFAELIKGLAVERDEATEWWEDEDRVKWYVALLNRTVNKITGWRGLKLDKIHARYYFDPDELGKPKSINYKPLNISNSDLMVVWQPVTKKTGQPKNFWYHRAVAISVVRVAKRSWCLALRPEMRITRDGVTPVDSDRVGSKVTKKKSKMWNIDVLEELNFWRSFLFKDEPRLIIRFGDFAALSISGNFLSERVRWPGVPPERARVFRNAEIQEDLFDVAAFDKLDPGYEEEIENLDGLDTVDDGGWDEA